jgi:hypothetical protein
VLSVHGVDVGVEVGAEHVDVADDGVVGGEHAEGLAIGPIDDEFVPGVLVYDCLPGRGLSLELRDCTYTVQHSPLQGSADVRQAVHGHAANILTTMIMLAQLSGTLISGSV